MPCPSEKLYSKAFFLLFLMSAIFHEDEFIWDSRLPQMWLLWHLKQLTLFVFLAEKLLSVRPSIFQSFRLACTIIVVCLGQTIHTTYDKGKSNYHNYHILFIIGDISELCVWRFSNLVSYDIVLALVVISSSCVLLIFLKSLEG